MIRVNHLKDCKIVYAKEILRIFNSIVFFRQGFQNAAELLIRKGANVNVVGENGNTALLKAAEKGKMVFTLELSYGIDIVWIFPFE